MLLELSRRCCCDGKLPTIHFVEDRLETLLAVVDHRTKSAENELENVKLYLVGE